MQGTHLAAGVTPYERIFFLLFTETVEFSLQSRSIVPCMDTHTHPIVDAVLKALARALYVPGL
jgi:hypothetical protein